MYRNGLALLAVLALTACDIVVDCGEGPCPQVLIVHLNKTTTTSPSTEASVPLVP
jgi:hypothetical protein